MSTMHTSAITVGRCEPADITRPQIVLPLTTNSLGVLWHQQRFVPIWSPQESNAQMIRTRVGLLGCHGSVAEVYELYAWGANCLNTFANVHVAVGPGRQIQ